MSFTSIDFAIFLPVVFFLYWALPAAYRWILLLGASYYFYMSWNAKCLVLIVGISFVSWICALLMEKTEEHRKRTFCLAAALVFSLGLLFIFKYLNFFLGTLDAVSAMLRLPFHPATYKILLPVGISFYTFQSLSYVIDVYRGDVKAERHFGKYAAFVAFFPQLVAGPIERTDALLPQIKKKHTFSYETAAYGMKRMAWGYFKKLVIADTMAFYVDQVYNQLPLFKGFALVLATFFFAIQIYCDFSGYSDIAAGAASILGIRLMTNFRSPYFATSIHDFWSRWHISLSTWFRDYVYIPLGGNRHGELRRDINLLLTFLVSGLWHGANWTFVLWGLLHGIMQVAENHLFKRGRKHPRLLVFAVVCFAWIFFRADTFADAGYVITHLFTGITSFRAYLSEGIGILDLNPSVRLSIALSLGLLAAYDAASLKTDVIGWVSKKPVLLRCLIYGGLIAFVYFQF